MNLFSESFKFHMSGTQNLNKLQIFENSLKKGFIPNRRDVNNDEDHTAFPSQTPKTRRTIGNFLRQWETNLNEYFGPMSKGLPRQYK